MTILPIKYLPLKLLHKNYFNIYIFTIYNYIKKDKRNANNCHLYKNRIVSVHNLNLQVNDILVYFMLIYNCDRNSTHIVLINNNKCFYYINP